MLFKIPYRKEEDKQVEKKCKHITKRIRIAKIFLNFSMTFYRNLLKKKEEEFLLNFFPATLIQIFKFIFFCFLSLHFILWL